MPKPKLHKASHVVYSINVHIYLVTRYRRKMLTQPMVDCIAEVVGGICQKHKSELVEHGAETDLVHFLIDLHPDNNISQLIKSFKSVTSKRIHQKFPTEFRQAFYRGNALWGRQKAVISCGGAPLDTVKRYVQNQADVTDKG